MTEDSITRIRQVLADTAGLGRDPFELGLDDDLYAAGMSSLASVQVMLALEDEFGIVFEDEMLKRDLLGTISSIEAAVQQLTSSAAS